MKKINTKIFLGIASITFSFSIFSQTGKVKSDTWEPLYKSPEVEVNYKYTECSLPEMGTQEESAYLQFKNLTNKKLYFKWSPTLWYSDKCYNCEGNDPEMTYLITLEPGQTIEGACSTDSPRKLKIFGKYLNVKHEGAVRELKDFQIKHARVDLVTQ